jgi:thymidylate kinase
LDLAYFSAWAAPRLTKGLDVLVMDRYFYDSLANLVAARDFTAVYVRLFKKILPKPDLAILLLVDPEIAFRRKPEYPLEYMRRRESAYRKVFEGVPQSLLLDGAADPRSIHDRIVSEIDLLTNHRSDTEHA